MIKRQIEHVKKWNEWRKYSLNSPISKLLVLFRIIKSPTFESYLTEKILLRNSVELMKQKKRTMKP